MSVSAVNTPVTTASARPRMYHVDLLRVMTFTCVVFVHSYGAMQPADSTDMSIVSLLMHFTRYSFVFITAFVLFFGYYRKDVRPATFWRRRFGAIVLPYVVWTLIYTTLGFINVYPTSVGQVGVKTAANLLFGTGWFHLYFLLVSMQFYFIFPAMRWLVRKTEGHHGKLLAVAAVLQVAIMLLFSYVEAPSEAILNKIWFLQSSIVPSYVLFCVLGALFAVHYERVREFVTAHGRWFIGVFALGIVGTLGMVLGRVALGTPAGQTSSPMHPDVLPWALGTILGMYALCTFWMARRQAGSLLARIVDFGSVRAFGVYAVHPFMIDLIWKPWQDNYLAIFGNRVPAGLAMFLSTMILSLIVVELMLRSPFAKGLVARSPLRKPKPAPAT